METFNRTEAVYALGKEVVDAAEAAHETDFGKHFWNLSDAERRDYLIGAMAARGCSAEYIKAAMLRLNSLVKNRDR